MSPRFFVRVHASTKRALLKLQEYDLDLFQPTARAAGENQFQIEGLLTLEQVGRLVLDGYSVLVEEEASKRAHGRQAIDFQEWIKGKEK